jgi:EmrB/QacA subfamily drug resistance transporter
MRSLGILSLAALAFSLAQTTLIPALAVLVGELHTTTTGVTWTLSGYLLTAAVATPLVGRLGDMFGKRRMLVVSLIVFGVGSVISALGNSIGVVIAGRAVMGVGGGIFPLCFGIIRDEFPRERVAVSIGLISAIFGIGGGAGLVVGGVLLDHASYHWIFWLGAAMAAVAAVAAALYVPESPVRTPGRVDVLGAVLLGVGIVLPLLAISNANQWGWGTPRTLGLIVGGAIVLVVWVVVELRTPEPLADVRSLARPVVATTNLATLLVGFGMFGSFILTPNLLEAPVRVGYGFGYSATTAGLVILPGALVMIVAGPASGLLSRRFGPKVSLALGAFVAAAGLGLLAVAHDTVVALATFNLVLSAGIALAFAAMPTLVMEASPPHETGEATGFNTLMRSVGASLGSQVTAAVLAGETIGHTAVPAEHAYTTAFLVCAGVALAAALVSVAIPTGGRGQEAMEGAVALDAAA